MQFVTGVNMKYKNVEKFDNTGLVKTFMIEKNQGRFRIFSHNKDVDMEDLKYYNELGDITPNQMIMIEQKHTNNIMVAKKEDGGMGVLREEIEGYYDGIITNEKELMLLTVEADCTPVYILDPVNKAIGMVHSGWRGTVKKVTEEAIKLMSKNYGTRVEDLMIHFGPAICGNCYEVGIDLYYEFKKILECDDIHRIMKPIVEKPEKFYLDVTEAIRMTLLQIGVKEENITRSKYCTYHSNLFHSWRLEQDKTKNMLTGIMLI